MKSDELREILAKAAREARLRRSDGKSAGPADPSKVAALDVILHDDMTLDGEPLHLRCQCSTAKGLVCGKPVRYICTLVFPEHREEGIGLGCALRRANVSRDHDLYPRLEAAPRIMKWSARDWIQGTQRTWYKSITRTGCRVVLDCDGELWGWTILRTRGSELIAAGAERYPTMQAAARGSWDNAMTLLYQAPPAKSRAGKPDEPAF